MIPLLEQLFQRLESEKVQYCHWKSNESLSVALEGQDDIDLLVDAGSLDRFNRILGQLGLKEVREPAWRATAGIRHHYGYDTTCATLVHVHAYQRLRTGGAILKEYLIPLHELLLRERRRSGLVFTPTPEAELVALVIRKALEAQSWLEFHMLKREEAKVRAEMQWLVDQCGDGPELRNRSARLLERRFPQVDPAVWWDSYLALREGVVALRRSAPAAALARSLSRFRVYSRLGSIARRGVKACGLVVGRFGWGTTKGRFGRGGLVVAVVGPEATGKSTVVRAVKEWLGAAVDVHVVHGGKPPPTLLTAAPRTVLPLLRKLAPRYRSGRVEEDRRESGRAAPVGSLRRFVYAVRSVMLAYERRLLMQRAFRAAASGAIILCDRYPTKQPGAQDSASLEAADPTSRSPRIMRLLMALECHLYQTISDPDLAVVLTVPVEVAVERNVARVKQGKETEDGVRRRHDQTRSQPYRFPRLVVIGTDRPLAETVADVKAAIWSHL